MEHILLLVAEKKYDEALLMAMKDPEYKDHAEILLQLSKLWKEKIKSDQNNDQQIQDNTSEESESESSSDQEEEEELQDDATLSEK
jgi:hypothetical protein